MQRASLLSIGLIILFSCNPQERPAKAIHELNASELPKGGKVIALVGATLIDGTGGQPLLNSCILIHNEKIEAVGKSGDVDIPAGALIVDVKGLTVMPGLIDAHYHNENSMDMASLYLQHGITSVRDPGAWIEAYDSLRKSGKLIPRLFLTGPHLNTYPPAYPKDALLVKDAEECRLAVDKLASQGATAIKVYFGLSIGMIRQTCIAAHAHGLPVTAHLEIANAKDAIDAGLDGIEHITSFGTCLLPAREAEKYKQIMMKDNEARRRGRYEVWATFDFEKSAVTDSLIRFLAIKKTFLSPTLAVFEKQKDRGDSIEVRGFSNMVKFAGRAKKGGARIVVGSHTDVPYAEEGFAYFREMELLGEAGLTNMEIIQAATIENARFFRIDDRLGTIENGKLADLIVISGNPLNNIRDTRNIKMIMLNGSWVSQNE